MPFMELLEELNTVSIFVRLALATVMGGIIGLERGRKRRPAGFRTHMLVCMGAALVMLTNQYIAQQYHLADPARLGAQVISGIGFLGAGTIIVTRHNQVIGLTTAAGLWASACMGLAIGVGFYTGAIMACLFILVAATALHRLDRVILERSRALEFFVEVTQPSDMSNLIRFLREREIRIDDIEFVKSRDPQQNHLAAVVTIKLPTSQPHGYMMQLLREQPGIAYVDEF